MTVTPIEALDVLASRESIPRFLLGLGIKDDEGMNCRSNTCPVARFLTYATGHSFSVGPSHAMTLINGAYKTFRLPDEVALAVDYYDREEERNEHERSNS